MYLSDVVLIGALPLGEHVPVNRTRNTPHMQDVVSQGL